MLVCWCSLAGTKACFSCPRYLEAFPTVEENIQPVKRYWPMYPQTVIVPVKKIEKHLKPVESNEI